MLGMFLIQLAVTTQVAECTIGQLESRLNPTRRFECQCDTRSLQNEHHTKEADRIAAHGNVIGVGDHGVRFDIWLGTPHALGIATGSGDVV